MSNETDNQEVHHGAPRESSDRGETTSGATSPTTASGSSAAVPNDGRGVDVASNADAHGDEHVERDGGRGRIAATAVDEDRARLDEVPTSMLTPTELAVARAEGRMRVTTRGLGFVTVHQRRETARGPCAAVPIAPPIEMVRSLVGWLKNMRPCHECAGVDLDKTHPSYPMKHEPDCDIGQTLERAGGWLADGRAAALLAAVEAMTPEERLAFTAAAPRGCAPGTHVTVVTSRVAHRPQPTMPKAGDAEPSATPEQFVRYLRFHATEWSDGFDPIAEAVIAERDDRIRRETIEACAKECDREAAEWRDRQNYTQGAGASWSADRLRKMAGTAQKETDRG